MSRANANVGVRVRRLPGILTISATAPQSETNGSGSAGAVLVVGLVMEEGTTLVSGVVLYGTYLPNQELSSPYLVRCAECTGIHSCGAGGGVRLEDLSPNVARRSIALAKADLGIAATIPMDIKDFHVVRLAGEGLDEDAEKKKSTKVRKTIPIDKKQKEKKLKRDGIRQ